MTNPADQIASTQHELRRLPERELQIEKQSLALLDSKLETEAYHWSLATIGAIVTEIAALDFSVLRYPQRMASLLLTIMLFNTLKNAWDSVLRGYYSVFLGQYRSLNEAELFLRAVLIDVDAARAWIDGTLKDTQAAKILRKYPDIPGDPRTMTTTSKFVQATGHASNMVAVASVARDSEKRLGFHLGPFFDAQRCQYFGLLLAVNAVPIALTVLQAFCDLLQNAESWVDEVEAYTSKTAPELEAKLSVLNRTYGLSRFSENLAQL